ncbi:MAG: hypothetical protein LUG93_01130 [Lachnospiraceae bacterium]|nr:hypothetical protein [Lachnospiraceae bacterium]
MSSVSFYIMIDFLIIGCGIYIIAQYAFMARTHELRQNMMLPKELHIARCKDVEGYIRTIGKKQLAFGIASTVCGVLSLVQDLVGSVNIYISMAAMVIFIVLCIWYGRESKKAIEKYW